MSASDTSSTEDNKGRKGSEDMIGYKRNIIWTSDVRKEEAQKL
jgi:hypothetical protein